MATRQATMDRFVFHFIFLVTMASQWATLHCRSGQWENYNQYDQYNTDNAGVTFSQLPTESTEFPSFSVESKAETPYDYYTANGDQRFSQTWDDSSTSFSAQSSTETFDPESTESTFADQKTYNPADNQFSFQANVDDDEVYFDTSAAETVYKAPDADKLSLAASLNHTARTSGEMLASLAKAMGGCGTGNPIDDCWRCDPNWRSHRQALANCAIGFGRNAIGGKNGKIYVVTSNGDNAQNPPFGTLRYGVTRAEPLWIIFAHSMTIQLHAELVMTSFKTIDGRGATVHIVGGSQITVKDISHVIIFGIHIHDIRPSGPSTILVAPSQLANHGTSDGDAIHIWGSTNVWVDHCYLANAADGLIDCTRGSSLITISNNYFTNHNKVMLFGSHPTDFYDRSLRITVAYNKFGPGLIQRMPRVRFGTVQVVNNDYTAGWGKYAIGGSEDPTILSQGNHFNPSGGVKEVTKRIDDGGPTFGGWQRWNWGSSGDVFLGGSYFTGSGAKVSSAGVYSQAFSVSPRPGSLVPALTASAGPLSS